MCTNILFGVTTILLASLETAYIHFQFHTCTHSLESRRRVTAANDDPRALARHVIDGQEDRRRTGRVHAAARRREERERLAVRRDAALHEHEAGAGVERVAREA